MPRSRSRTASPLNENSLVMWTTIVEPSTCRGLVESNFQFKEGHAERHMRPAAAASPTRTLFVRGLGLSTTEADIMTFFSTFGDIRKITSFIETKGIAFVTFYDLRHAEAALGKNGQELLGKKLEVAFSTPKEKDDERPDADTLFVIKKGNTAPIDSSELARVFAQWGELKRIGDNVRSQVQKFVQYYDTRAIARALKEAGGMSFGGGTLDVEEAKSNFSGRPPRERTRAGVAGESSRRRSNSRSRSRSRSNSRDRDRRSHRSSRRRRSRSNSPSSSASSSRKRRSRSRSRSRSRDRDRKQPSTAPPVLGAADWAREAASASIYGAMAPHAVSPFLGYVQQQPQQAPPPPVQQQFDPQQVMALAQQNPQLLQMLLMQLQQQQQQQPMAQQGLPPMQMGMPQQQQQPLQQQQQQQQQQPPRFPPQYQTMPNYGNANYSPPAGAPRLGPQNGGQQPNAALGTASLASLAASLERLKKK